MCGAVKAGHSDTAGISGTSSESLHNDTSGVVISEIEKTKLDISRKNRFQIFDASK